MRNLMTKLKTGIAIGAMALGTMMGATGAKADLTYNYNGVTLSGDFGSRIISGFVTIKDSAKITELTDATPNAVSFIFADVNTNDLFDFQFITTGLGANLLIDDSNVNSTGFTFDLTTDALGQITDWDINIIDTTSGCRGLFSDDCRIKIKYASNELASYDLIFILLQTGTAPFNTDHTYWTPGPIQSPSPEVTGLMLGGLGLMGFAALRRK